MEEGRQLVAKNEVEVIDLRDDDAWIDGHIPGAHHAGEDLDDALGKIPDDRKLLIVCADGKRSAEVAGELDGDRDAVVLEGGFDAWESEGLRTQPTGDYVPGPAPVEGEDDDKAAEAAEGTIEDEKKKQEFEDEEPDVTSDSGPEDDAEDDNNSQ